TFASHERRHAVELPVKVEKLARRQPVVKAKVLGQEPYPRAGLGVGVRTPQEDRVASGRLDKAEHHLDHGRLASAIRTEEAHDVSLSRGEVETLDRDAGSVDLAQPTQLERWRWQIRTVRSHPRP